mgnify:CR=1 FL=1
MIFSSNPLFNSLKIYIIIIIILVYFKPEFIYDNKTKKFKQFGSNKGNTIFSLPILFPMAFTLCGNSEKYAPGVVISIISTYSIVGMLIGPPLIGYVAYILNLRSSFIIFLICGIMLILIAKMLFLIEKPSTYEP